MLDSKYFDSFVGDVVSDSLCSYHYFFNPQKQQIYQNSQLLVAMAVNLGINRMPDVQTVTTLDVVSFLTPRLFAHKLNPQDPECRRTICGVYVVSAG